MDARRVPALSTPGWARRIDRPGRDRVLVGLVAVPVLVSGVLDGRLTTFVCGIVAIAAIPLRRRHPVMALALALAVAALQPTDGALVLPSLVVLYGVARDQTWPPIALGGIGLAGGAAMLWLCWGHDRARHGPVGFVAAAGALCAAAVTVGLYRGARRKVSEGLADRVEQETRERELLTERAVADERLRIARELHDVVAHTVSLMVVQAQALGATVDDERVLAGTDAIAGLGRQAMAEMHRTLRLLRANGSAAAELTPQPGLADLAGLLDRSRAAGLPVDLIIEGEPRPLSQTADLSAFRIVQEALTNVLKHAGTVRTTIALAYGPDLLGVTVTDDGARAPSGPSEWYGGHGLTGMRERVALFGGTVSAGPHIARGFEVRATLPYEAAPS